MKFIRYKKGIFLLIFIIFAEKENELRVMQD